MCTLSFTCLIAGKERGLKVVQLFPEEGNLGLVLPKDLAKWTMGKVRKEGIEVHPGNTLETAVVEDGKVKVKLSGGEEVRVCVCACVCVRACVRACVRVCVCVCVCVRV